MKKNPCIWLLGILLVCGIGFIGCPGSDPDEPDQLPPAAGITILHQPTSRDYVTGTAAAPLYVEPSKQAAGLTYQWYENTTFSNQGGTEIAGETADTFSNIPNSVAQDYFYYAQLKYHDEDTDADVTLTSNPARIRFSAAATAAPANGFTVDSTRYNYVRGFGGTSEFMFRDGSFANACAPVDVEYIRKLMAPDQVGANILRIMLYDDYKGVIEDGIQDAEAGVGTSFFQDNTDYFDIIKTANSYGAYVFASPWTAPASMKTNGRPGGGGVAQPALLKPGSEIDFANYIREYLKYLNDHNAPIYAVSILNEPNWGASATYEGMTWGNEEMRDWWKLVGHITTQRVVSGTTAADVVYADDVIPGFGGGKPTHHVLTMNGESANNPNINDPVLNDPVANKRVELFGRHLYGEQVRYTKLLGTASTAYENMPDASYDSGRSDGWNGQREMWMTEHLPDNSGAVKQTWPYVFDLLNEMDHTVRVNGESAYCLWFSQEDAGLVFSSAESRNGATPGGISNRGRAFAHYTRFANETFRIGVERTTGSIAYNPTISNFDNVLADNTMKISAYEDPDGKFISVVMFTPLTRSSGAAGAAPGEMKITLPAGFTAKSAYGLKSDATTQWADEPVVLSADGKSAIVDLPAGTILSVKFVK